MAEPLKLSDLDLHVEHLVPGIILTLELYWALPPAVIARMAVPDQFVAGAGFIALSYSLGVILSTSSRAVIDSILERGLRASILRRYAHVGAGDLKIRFQDQPRFKQDLIREGQLGRKSPIADWNAVYRAALRSSVSQEVQRRRAQGRLLRSLIAAVAFGGMIAVAGSFEQWWNSVLAGAAAFAVLAGVMIWLFGYAEYVAVAEALDIAPTNSSVSAAT